MTVRIRRKRNKTAKEVAEKFDMSERTVRRYISEHRNDYEHRADKRRQTAYNLRLQGKKWKEVGEVLGCSSEAARALYSRYLALQEKKLKKAEKMKEKTDNYDLFLDSL